MPRFEAVGAVHHVISRFVDRSWQLAGDQEREAYLDRLAHALARTDWTLLGYALMSSHVHLVLEGGEGPVGNWTKSTHSRMARWLNIRHGRSGPVFFDRPYVETVDDSRVPYLVAYVHNNPVRARLVGWAGDCTWTSHRAYLELEPPRSMLHVAQGLTRCGFQHDPAGIASFDTWVRACLGDTKLEHAGTLIRQARLRARELAGPHAEIATPCQGEEGLTLPIALPARTTWHLSRADVQPDEVIAIIVDILGVDARGRGARDHRPAVTQARRAALAAWTRTRQPLVHMARALGIGSSAASDLLARRPERIPAAVVDQVMRRLEEGEASKAGACLKAE